MEPTRRADPPLLGLVWKAESNAKRFLSRAKVLFDETFHTIEHRTPGPVFVRPIDDPEGVYNKTPDIDSAVARLRQQTIVGYPFSVQVNGFKVSGHMDLPAILASARINPKVIFEQRDPVPC